MNVSWTPRFSKRVFRELIHSPISTLNQTIFQTTKVESTMYTHQGTLIPHVRRVIYTAKPSLPVGITRIELAHKTHRL